MKKLLVSALAIVGLVACSQEQTLVSKSPASMEFGVASLDKATRVDPSLTADNLTGFNVWAWMDDESGNVLTAEDVEKVGGVWGYFNTAYWMPGHNYSFAAVAPMDSANWTYNLNDANNGEDNTIDFKNIDGTEDLIYAFATRSTVGHAVGQDYKAVELRFNHLLSKTKFTFKNGFATNNVTLQVSDVKVEAYNAATYSINDAAWGEVAGEKITLQYGDTEVIAAGANCAVADERLTIPAAATASYKVTYTVDVWQGANKAIDRLVKETVIKGLEFVQGKAYNFVAEITPESLNLDEIEFTVVVEEWVKQDVNVGQIEDTVTFVSTIEELQAALNAATTDATVVLGADLVGNVTVPELKDATIAIYGNGNKFDGCFFIDGNSSYDKGTTIFDGVNFVTSDNSTLVGDAFIYCGEAKGTSYRYPDNVIVKDCTFTAEGAAVDAAVGIKFWSLNGNLVVENSKAEGMHSLMQLTSCGKATVLVDGVEVVNCKNGLSLQFSDNTIRNSNIVAREYGVRANGNDGATSIVNSTIEAKQPVIVRKTTVAGYTVNVDAATELKTAEAFQVIFTKDNDDAAYVAPEVAFTFNGPATTSVFPGLAADAVVANNTEEFNAAIAAKKANIVLVGGETYTGAFKLTYPANITAKGGKAVIAGRFDVNSYATGSTFANLKFEITADSKVKNVFTGANYKYPSTVNIYAAAASFENCEFATDIASGVCGINYGSHVAGGMLKVNNCSFVGDFYAIRTRTLFEITNCTFDIYTTQGTLAAVWTWGNGNSGADKVTFVGNKNVNANKVYGVQLTSTTFAYDKLVVNVKNNDNFLALADGVNPDCNFAGTTFVAGSEEFAF